MSLDALTAAGIDSLVSSYTQTETTNKITPLTTRKTKYQGISSAYGNLSKNLDSLKTSLSTLRLTGTESAFTTKTATLSSSTFFTASADKTAALSSFDVRVNQLAKNDSVVTSTLKSDDINTSATGIHTIKIKSGDYTSNVDVDFGSTAITNQAAMEKIQNAISSDKAVVTSASVSGNYTGSAGSFTLDLNGTTKTINYDSGKSYSDIIDSIITQIGSTSGLKAEKVVDGNNVQLKFTVTDSSKYITINQSSDTGSLLNSSNLNIDVTKEKGASGIVSSSVFSPSTDTSKLSITSLTTGYDNRLEITSEDSLTSLGLTSDVLTNRYKNSDDGTTVDNTKAGFTLGTQWLKTDSTVGGTAETSTANNLNSKIDFNGLSIQRNSNTISDLVTGVTLTLKAAMASTDSTVTASVKNDTSGVKSTINDFITKFNNVYAYLKEATASSDGIRGPLIGDANATSLMSMLSSAAYSKISGLSDDSINQLSKMGITFSSTSGLSITDSTALDSALSDHADQVEAVFNSDNGIGTVLYKGVSSYTGTGGFLAKSKSSIDSNIVSIGDKITSTQEKIDKSAESLRAKYQDLQSQLATLLTTQSSLTSTDYSSVLSSLF